jgi:antitoxin component of MazEF toxin-antitoxin module
LKRKVYKNGNSLVIALSDAAKEVLKLKEGDTVNLEVKNKKLIITKSKEDKKNE